MVCDMEIDAEGEVTRSKFYDAVMFSHARLTYNKVWQAVGERNADVRDEIADVLPQVETLHKLYKVMAKARKRRGAIDFETPEVKFRLGPAGDVQSMGASDRNDAHKMIEECMIAANVQAARFLTKRKVPALYRVHAPPPAEKYDDLLQFLKEFKLKMPPADEVTPADFSALLKKVQDRPEAELIQSVLLRAQSMAIYHPENHGHFGLALDAYAHFTSPIRRYPDLLVHRAIRYAITRGKPSEYIYSDTQMAAMAIHCSQRERRAEEAERDVDERFKCAWMEKHVGEEFAGTITGVTSFGLFVELAASRVSGLVHVSQLPNDYYKFDPVRHLLQGERTGAAYRLGDYVSVQVLRASLEDRKIDFRLIARLAALPKPAPKVAAPVAAPRSGMMEAGRAMGRAAKKAVGRIFGKKSPAPVAVEEPVAPKARPERSAPADTTADRSERSSQRGSRQRGPRQAGGGESRQDDNRSGNRRGPRRDDTRDTSPSPSSEAPARGRATSKRGGAPAGAGSSGEGRSSAPAVKKTAMKPSAAPSDASMTDAPSSEQVPAKKSTTRRGPRKPRSKPQA
jgi:ribonuclease R